MDWLILCSGRLSLPVLHQLAWLFPFPLACVPLELRPLPIPRHYPAFTGTTSLSATPPAQAAPRGFPVWRGRATDGASRVASVPLLHACCRHYPGGDDRCARRSLPDSPCLRRRLRINLFEACSAFTWLRPACSLSRPTATLFHQSASVHVVTSMSRTGTTVCRAGFAPAGGQCLSTAHINKTTYGPYHALWRVQVFQAVPAHAKARKMAVSGQAEPIQHPLCCPDASWAERRRARLRTRPPA